MVPVALGVALAKKLRGEDGIAVVFIGDGTLGEGALYESMNIASLWGVRLLIVLEDNQIAQTTPSSVAVAGDMLARAEAFGIDTARLEGADAPALEQELAALVETMRGQAAPVFRVIGTVRLGPHWKRDDERSAEEMEELGGATRSPGSRRWSTTPRRSRPRWRPSSTPRSRRRRRARSPTSSRISATSGRRSTRPLRQRRGRARSKASRVSSRS